MNSGQAAMMNAPSPSSGSAGRAHVFRAVAFVENFNLKALAPAFPNAHLTPRELRVGLESGGELSLYPFGAAVFRDVSAEAEELELARLRAGSSGAHRRGGAGGILGCRNGRPAEPV
jgi:hypothetical protein